MALSAWLEHAPRPAQPILVLAEALVRGGVALRRAAYKSGLFRSRRVSCPVISVGNLTVGGNGKTPLVLDLAGRLKAWGLEVAVVTRGYGAPRPTRGGPRVVARRGQLLAEPEAAGDEPLMIGARAGISVVVSGDRITGAQLAIEELGAQVILLDDGFQHWRLARDLDVVLVDAMRPFGNGHLMPRGRLREPPAALARADLVVVHRGDVARLAPISSELSGEVQVAIRPRCLRRGEVRVAPETLLGARVALAAGIARPDRFRATVEVLGATVVDQCFFPDHAPFSRADVSQVLTRAKEHGADRIVITEKDAARMGGRSDLAEAWVLELDLLVVAGEEVLSAALRRAVEQGGRRSPG